jgi:hypothetical protein
MESGSTRTWSPGSRPSTANRLEPDVNCADQIADLFLISWVSCHFPALVLWSIVLLHLSFNKAIFVWSLVINSVGVFDAIQRLRQRLVAVGIAEMTKLD